MVSHHHTSLCSMEVFADTYFIGGWSPPQGIFVSKVDIVLRYL